ncbi:MAG: FAD-dependent oxidoreductase [Patescibacteria group bacterium]
MTIAIVGAGFTALSAAWELVKEGHSIVLFERESFAGGLAAGFKEKRWDWSLENHYHHLFTSDHDVISLMKELGAAERLNIYQTKTSTLYDGQIWRLDSATSLLKFSKISILDRLRMGVVLFFLVLFPWGKFLEKWTAKEFIKKTMGSRAWKVVWKPLFVGKFGKYSSVVNMAWFWARVVSRTKNLAYFQGGFLRLAELLSSALKKKGVELNFAFEVDSIEKNDRGMFLIGGKIFDRVIVTGPATLLTNLVKNLPSKFAKSINQLDSLAAQTLILQLIEPFFQDGTYWLNINEEGWPFLALVEHTSMVDSSKYNKKHLLYVAKYLESADKDFSLSKEQLFKKYLPYLKKINPSVGKIVNKVWLNKAPFAQPIVYTNHSRNVPVIRTPIKGLYWASMQHIYPWDRGINYAVRLGKEVAHIVNEDQFN